MTVDAGWALQVAVVTALAADADLATAMGGTATVLDHVPENQAMPYVEYEDNDSSEWDTGEEEDGSMGYGAEHTIRLFCWSSYEGKKQAKAMLDAINRRIRDADDLNLTINGHRLINIRRMFSYVLRDPDLQAYYGVIQFRAVTEEINEAVGQVWTAADLEQYFPSDGTVTRQGNDLLLEYGADFTIPDTEGLLRITADDMHEIGAPGERPLVRFLISGAPIYVSSSGDAGRPFFLQYDFYGKLRLLSNSSGLSAHIHNIRIERLD